MRQSIEEVVYKQKAAENFGAAKLLRLKHPNASASRAYYAVFLAAVGEYVRLGVKPELIDRGAAESFKLNGAKWTHSFVRSNAKMLGLDSRQCEVLRSAYNLRCVADYLSTPVDEMELIRILRNAEDILECLGVNVGGLHGS